MQYEFRVTGHLQSGRVEQGETAAQHVSTMIGLPQELGGSARGTNLKEMVFTTATEQMCVISNAIRGSVEIVVVANEASCEGPR